MRENCEKQKKLKKKKVRIEGKKSIKYKLSAQLAQFCNVYKYPKRPNYRGNQISGELNWCQFIQFMNGLIMDQTNPKITIK